MRRTFLTVFSSTPSALPIARNAIPRFLACPSLGPDALGDGSWVKTANSSGTPPRFELVAIASAAGRAVIP